MTLALVAAAVLAALLATVNRRSNDNHVEVAAIILEEDVLPTPRFCQECFQPKLYHLAMARIGQALGRTSGDDLRRIGQYLNVLFGLCTVALLILFLGRIPLPDHGKALFVLLAAFNPALMKAWSMSTNDATVILTSCMSMYFLWLYHRKPGGWRVPLLVSAVILAGLSKGNGLVMFIGLVIFLATRALDRRHRRRSLLHLAAAFLAYVAIVPIGGQYYEIKQGSGPRFIIPINARETPHLIKETRVERPGITSIAHGFLTFRLPGLLKDVYTHGDYKGYARHRTSYWTFIYSGINYASEACWPPGWEPVNRLHLNLARISYLSALLPIGVLLWGIFLGLAAMARAVRRLDVRYFSEGFDWPVTLFIAGHIGFSVVYTFVKRDFATIKALFLMPGLLAYGWAFVKGFNALAAREDRRSRRVRRAVIVSSAILIASYVGTLSMTLGRLSGPDALYWEGKPGDMFTISR